MLVNPMRQTTLWFKAQSAKSLLGKFSRKIGNFKVFNFHLEKPLPAIGILAARALLFSLSARLSNAILQGWN